MPLSIPTQDMIYISELIVYSKQNTQMVLFILLSDFVLNVQVFPGSLSTVNGLADTVS